MHDAILYGVNIPTETRFFWCLAACLVSSSLTHLFSLDQHFLSSVGVRGYLGIPIEALHPRTMVFSTKFRTFDFQQLPNLMSYKPALVWTLAMK